MEADAQQTCGCVIFTSSFVVASNAGFNAASICGKALADLCEMKQTVAAASPSMAMNHADVDGEYGEADMEELHVKLLDSNGQQASYGGSNFVSVRR
ncbi:hypothetical protein Dimus_008179 [Dionaea muscipula]